MAASRHTVLHTTQVGPRPVNAGGGRQRGQNHLPRGTRRLPMHRKWQQASHPSHSKPNPSSTLQTKHGLFVDVEPGSPAAGEDEEGGTREGDGG